MKTKLDNPSPATLLKREQRERLSNGVPNAKGRVKQCDLANNAVSKSDPKERLQKLMQDNKISVMGLKRCYSDGTIDESVLCLLGIPFRRKSSVTKEKNVVKKEPKVSTVIQVETPKSEDTSELKAPQFVERNALYQHDNVRRQTKAEADIANALVKIQHELVRQDQLAENEKRIAKSAPVSAPASIPQVGRVKPGGRQRTLEDQIKQQKNQTVVQLLNQSGFMDTKIQ
jgi:hypothetical protein